MWGGDRALPRLAYPSVRHRSAHPQESTPRAQLKAGVSNTPPFAIETETDSGSDWDGIGVHLWREVAEELDIQYEWQILESGEAVQRVQDGTVDIAITATATAEGE